MCLCGVLTLLLGKMGLLKVFRIHRRRVQCGMKRTIDVSQIMGIGGQDSTESLGILGIHRGRAWHGGGGN
jgi:hypothetical protein